MSVKFVAYYRVSTKEQGESGLGLESQMSSVQSYVDSIKGEIIAHYTDIESGKNNNRENLWAAVTVAKENNATLIVKKFDRLSRGGLEVMARLEKYNVPFIECDSPHDNTLLKEIKFSIARDEVKKISERTSAALKMIKKKVESGEKYVSRSGNVITKLGSSQNFSNEGREKGRNVIKDKARSNENNKKAWAMIQVMMKNEKFNNNKAAKQLNESGFKTANDSEFTGVQVKRLIKLFEE